MPKYSDILGMNAREQIFSPYNSATARSFASSKSATKVLLQNKNIPTPESFAFITSSEDLAEFDFKSMEGNFVIKPTNGNAGKGVVAFKKQHADKEHWTDTSGVVWGLDDILLHCHDILEGQYSTYGQQHNIIIEERVATHPVLRKYAVKGTPDVRIIVFNQVPVMAMLRLPTEQSGGRANLHQGAIGVGVDIATGITTSAITGSGTPIQFLPGTKRKLNGIKIPFWKQLLITAVEAAEAAQLKYGGIDLFVHEQKGPQVVELNANPGLSIQNANQAGLRRRLERVLDLNVLNSKHGVKIGQSLFAEHFADKITSEEGLAILQPKEKITIYDNNKKAHELKALMNTSRFRSAIAKKKAEDLNLLSVEDLLWFQSSQEGTSPVIEVVLKIKDRKIKTTAVISKKLDKSSHSIEIGLNDLKGFLVGETE